MYNSVILSRQSRSVLKKSCPTWSLYWYLKEVFLIMMDKYSSVRPVGIGNTWQHFFTKCVFAVVGVDAKEAYGVWPLCGLPPGGVLIIWATMAWACSLVFLLPP